jgi:hypothetical protein
MTEGVMPEGLIMMKTMVEESAVTGTDHDVDIRRGPKKEVGITGEIIIRGVKVGIEYQVTMKMLLKKIMKRIMTHWQTILLSSMTIQLSLNSLRCHRMPNWQNSKVVLSLLPTIALLDVDVNIVSKRLISGVKKAEEINKILLINQ